MCRRIAGPQAGGFALPNAVTFTSNGTYTPSPNVEYIEVYVTGGGGGGSKGGSNSGSGGGGGGTTYKILAPTVTAVTIGAGGAGSVVTAAGGAGGSSSFGAVVGGGGSGGDISTSGSCGGGLGGTIFNGEVNVMRESGKAANGFQGGNGGSSMFGTGGKAIFNSSLDKNGLDGTGYGSGGAGGTGNGNGGDGVPGIVIVIEHF